MSFEELHEDCSRRFKEKEEREGLPEKPGVHEILEYLKENRIPTALASSTRRLPEANRQAIVKAGTVPLEGVKLVGIKHIRDLTI